MRTEAWVYGAVAVLCVGAGVAIAGVPNSPRRDPTIRVPATVPDAESTSTTSTSPDAPSRTTVSVTTTREPATTAASSTAAESTTTAASTTAAASQQVAVPTTDVATTARALPDRTEVEVSVVNGADIAGVGRRTTLEMNDLGYLDVILFDGTEIVDRSAIFVSSEWRPVGLLIAEEIGISEDDVLPIDSAPTVDGLGETPVIVYLGRDAETLKLFG